jgi:hypothetical protein
MVGQPPVSPATWARYNAASSRTMRMGELKIVQKKVKKPKGKQDMKMAISEGWEEEPTVDVEMTEVGQSKRTGQQDMEISGSEGRLTTEVDLEMAEVNRRLQPEVSMIAHKGKGRATPAIMVEPPTLVKGLTDLAQAGLAATIYIM